MFNHNKCKKLLPYSYCTLVYLLAALFSDSLNLLAASLLFFSSVILYFFFSREEPQSFIKVNALFSGIWMGTIGLSQLRIMEYQVAWEPETWMMLWLGQIAIYIGSDISKLLSSFLMKRTSGFFAKWDRIWQIPTSQFILYKVIAVSSVIGLLSFLINVRIKGYIPAFVMKDNPGAYVEFYTRFHVFLVASTVCGGFAFYLLKVGQIQIKQKLVLGSIILVLNFVIPLLLVQRGLFLIAATVLITFIYLLSSKKFWILLLSLVIVLGIYQFGASLRGYSENQLGETFKTDPKYRINGQVAFLYTYFTVSHDNFNSVVSELDEHSNGLLQLRPFNVILRIDRLKENILIVEKSLPEYFVRPQFNTFNLISDFFIDFGYFGVFLFCALYSLLFGIIEHLSWNTRNPFLIALNGVCIIPIMFSFFASWMSNFTLWLFFGTILLIQMVSGYLINKLATQS